MEGEEGSGDREREGKEARPAYTGNEWKRTKAESGSLFLLCGHQAERRELDVHTVSPLAVTQSGRGRRGNRDKDKRWVSSWMFQAVTLRDRVMPVWRGEAAAAALGCQAASPVWREQDCISAGNTKPGKEKREDRQPVILCHDWEEEEGGDSLKSWTRWGWRWGGGEEVKGKWRGTPPLMCSTYPHLSDTKHAAQTQQRLLVYS